MCVSLTASVTPQYTLSDLSTYYTNADSYSAEAFQLGKKKFALYLERGRIRGGVRKIYLQVINTRSAFFSIDLGNKKIFEGKKKDEEKKNIEGIIFNFFINKIRF